VNKRGREQRRVRRRVRSPISGGSFSAAFLFPRLHLDSGIITNRPSMSAARYHRRKKERKREKDELGRRKENQFRTGREEMERPSVSTDRIQNWYSFRGLTDCDLSKKSQKTLVRVPLSLSLSPSFSLPFSFPLLANDSCCDRCQDASLPRAIIQWPPFFLRGYHAPIAESADPREIMDCHDVLSITGLRTSADTPGYPRVVPRFRRATILR